LASWREDAVAGRRRGGAGKNTFLRNEPKDVVNP
jgi:hypothetical protein